MTTTDSYEWPEFDRETGQLTVHKETGDPCTCGGLDLPHPSGRVRGCTAGTPAGPGRMEAAVAAEIAEIGPKAATLAVGAMVLAQSLDRFSGSAESAAQLGAIVKTHQELRQTLNALRKANEGDERGRVDDVEGLSTPT